MSICHFLHGSPKPGDGAPRLHWAAFEPARLRTAAPNCPTGCLCMSLGRAIPHEASLARKVAASVSLRFPCPSLGDGESIGLVSYAPPAPLFGPRRGSSRGRRIPLPLPTLCPSRASAGLIPNPTIRNAEKVGVSEQNVMQKKQHQQSDISPPSDASVPVCFCRPHLSLCVLAGSQHIHNGVVSGGGMQVLTYLQAHTAVARKKTHRYTRRKLIGLYFCCISASGKYVFCSEVVFFFVQGQWCFPQNTLWRVRCCIQSHRKRNTLFIEPKILHGIPAEWIPFRSFSGFTPSNINNAHVPSL